MVVRYNGGFVISRFFFINFTIIGVKKIFHYIEVSYIEVPLKMNGVPLMFDVKHETHHHPMKHQEES